MSRRVLGIVSSFLLMAGIAAAQAPAGSTTTSTRQVKFEVVSVDGNTVVWRNEAGETKEFKAPAGFMVNVDGKDMPVSDLQPGMKGTATVTTTTKMTPVTVTDVKNGKVMAKAGNAIIVQMADGKMRQFTQQDVQKRNAKIYKDGQQIELSQLQVGDNMSATIVTEGEPKIVTTNQVKAMAHSAPKPAPAAAPAPAPAPAAEPAPAPAPAKKLPKTGSELPLVGLLGGLSLAAGYGLTRLRRSLAR
ncbi:MAG TPA: LPXTG cell wall anchor domain-containing protein [Thermoanaerobaculia bacterium]|nr:LPXTG cell wall anchor domain-containing protein [Thermoanaerobaculia bacterium]